MALGSIHQLEARDRQTLGFDPEPWLKTQRARILMYLEDFRSRGSSTRCWSCLRRTSFTSSMRMAPRSKAIAAAGRTLRSMRSTGCRPSCAKCDAVSAGPGNRRALALLANNTPQEAADLVIETIEYSRTQKAGLEIEPYLLTILTEALIATGSAEARTTAVQARDLARHRAMRTASAMPTATARLSSITGEFTSLASSAYSSAMRRQSVSSAADALAWQATIAACSA